MAVQWSLLGDVAESVISWLDARHLGRLEAAGKHADTDVIGRCWGTLAKVEQCIVESRPWFVQVFPEDVSDNGKEALKELFKMRLQLNTVPDSWSPEIRPISPSSLHVSPLDCNGCVSSDGAAVDPPRLPQIASVPLALGTILGDEMSIGLRVQSKGGSSHEGVWLALEITGVDDAQGKVMSLLFAPLTGRCMVTMSGQPEKLVAQAMHPLAGSLCDSVDAFVTMSESGDVEFVRISEASNSITRSGKIRYEALFPNWASKVFASVQVQIKDVLSETTVSIKKPPPDMLQEQNHPESAVMFDAVWSVID